MHPLAVAALGSILRHLLTYGAGYLVAKGVWSEAEATEYVAAAALAIIGVAWSVWQKSKARRVVLKEVYGEYQP